MSRQINLKDAKAGMWVEFDTIEHDESNGHVPGWHFAGKLLDISGLTFETFLTFLLDDHQTFGVEGSVVFPDTDDSAFALFYVCDGEAKPWKYVRNVRLYESKPEGNDSAAISDITKVVAGDTVLTTDGNKYVVLKTSQAENAQHLYVRPTELSTGDGFWLDDSYFDQAFIKEYDVKDLPQDKGFYRANTGSVWKYDGQLWAPVLDHDGNLAPSHPTAFQNRKHFRKSSVKAGRSPFVKVEATFQ